MSLFSFFSGASTTPAAQSAVLLSNNDLVNQQVANPAQERYPGAVNPNQYGPGSATDHPYAAPKNQPPEPFTARTPQSVSGGGWQDTAWMSGHDAPQVPWDSQNQGESIYRGPGAVNPELHADDTGGVFRHTYATPPVIGSLRRHTMYGQTTIRQSGDTLIRDGQTAPNNRQDMDQQQWWNSDGYAPHPVPYAERPIMNNVAYESIPTNDPGNQYSPSGNLTGNAPHSYAAETYGAPPDPYVGQPGTNSNGIIGSSWTL